MKQQNFNTQRTSGFTLVELVVVIIIVSILALGSSVLLIEGFQTYAVSQNTMDAQARSRLALGIMTRDLQAIRSPVDIISKSSSSINFIDVNGKNITYQVSGGQLQRLISGGPTGSYQTLTNNVQSMTMSYYDATGVATIQNAAIRYITIVLTMNVNNIVFTLDTGVYPWNLK